MGVRTTRRSVAAAILVMTVGLAGCAAPPSAAATVNGVVVSQTDLTDRTAAVVGSATVTTEDLTAVNRGQLTAAIRHQLLTRAAARQNISVTPQQLNAALGQGPAAEFAGQLGVPVGELPNTVRDLLTLQELVQRIPADGAQVTDVTVTVIGLQVSSRDEAVAKRAEFAQEAAAQAAVAAAGSNGIPRRDFSLVASSSLAGTGLFLAKPGEVILVPQQGGYAVLRVLDRQVGPSRLTSQQIVQQIQTQSGLDLQALQSIGALLLSVEAGQAGIEVNPRYGRWDPLALQVVPGNSGL